MSQSPNLSAVLRLGLVPIVVAGLWFPIAHAADPINTPHSSFQDPFRPMDEDWPTPNDIRTASGAPGAHYWQQKVDYKMRVRLDVPTRTLHGDEEITYHNHSPDTLRYLWVLVDQDRFRNEALRERTRTTSPDAPVTFQEIERMQRMRTWQGGFTIEALNDGQGQALRHIVVDALMRVDLNHPLAPGATLRLHTTWSLPMIESSLLGGRSGYSCFEGHKLLRPGSPKVGGADHTVSCVYQAGQWFPRLAAYDDQGWHNDPFLGAGEFPLEFGDYDVSITVPSNHVVAATGELQNAAAVLTSPQRARLAAARTADHPIFVVTPAEAEAHERNPAAGEKTWTFKARNVRDFAFASSRKYIWDAMGVRVDGAKDLVTMAMSFYPNEGRPLWSTYATKAIAHTLRVYGRFTYPYPYPVAQATWGDIGGYENPMLSFIDGGLPRLDEITGAITYSARDKFGLVGEIIHETGHNWFPETVNSDERRWAWMDEGINSFLETEARELWDPAFPNVKGNPRSIVACMTAPDQVPIMVRPDYAPDTGCPFYLKPATALVVLRETVMGRELFDYAFREYARRWRFKRATPYDFFRTMQDASGVDLGWFWRGWFYGTDHVDVALERVVQGRLDTRDPDVEAAQSKRVADAEPKPLTVLRNTETPVVVADPSLRDFYDEPSSSSVSTAERERAKAALEKLKPEDRAALADPDHFYRFTFVNVGGLVTPIPLKLTYDDGSSEVIHIPVQVWRINSKRVVWPFATPKTLVSAEVDPAWETGDTDRSNNFYPGRIETQTFKIPDRSESSNPMRDQGLSVTRDSLKTVPVSHP